MVASQEGPCTCGEQVPGTITSSTRLRIIAGIRQNPLTLLLQPSASDPSYTTVRVHPGLVLTDYNGQVLSVETLSPGATIALRVAPGPDGVVATQLRLVSASAAQGPLPAR